MHGLGFGRLADTGWTGSGWTGGSGRSWSGGTLESRTWAPARAALGSGRPRTAAAEVPGLGDDGGERVGRVVERARAGESGAFAELFHDFEPDVTRVCRRMLGAGPAAEDAAAEVFLRARRSLDGFQTGRPFRPWLLRIANHHCIDLLRRRRTEAQLFERGDLEIEGLADPGPSPLRRVAGAEQRAEVLAALDELPDKYRLPLVLRYWSELDYAAIADVLGVTREQVGTLLFRARRRLRERLATGAPEEKP